MVSSNGRRAIDGPDTPRRRPGRPRHEAPSAEYRLRQAEIVETAAQVFRDKGYEAGTLDDVAAALDIRRASVYYYIESKGHLLYLVIDRALRIAIEKLDLLERQLDDPGEWLAALIRHQVETITDDRNFFSVFFDHRLHLEPRFEELIRQQELRYYRAFVQAVRQGAAKGVIPRVNARLGAQAIIGMTTWVYKWFDPTTDDVDAFAEVCVGLILGSAPARDKRSRAGRTSATS